MDPGDLDALRRHGFSDVEILEIVTLTGFFNCITRVADGLGVESNAERKAWEAYLFRDQPGPGDPAQRPHPPSGGPE